MDEWQPATVEYVKQLAISDLQECDEAQLALFKKVAVNPYRAPISRYGNIDTVVVIARNGSEVIYYEDEEEGFNVSPIGPDGTILEHWCNHDELKFALNYRIEGRTPSSKVGPARPID